jgi:hypothetical protein
MPGDSTYMSSPSLNQAIFTVDITRAIPETQPQSYVESEADPALTARAMVAVVSLGAGFWYVLCRTALHFLAGH